eukprot:sb/3472406/
MFDFVIYCFSSLPPISPQRIQSLCRKSNRHTWNISHNPSSPLSLTAVLECRLVKGVCCFAADIQTQLRERIGIGKKEEGEKGRVRECDFIVTFLLYSVQFLHPFSPSPPSGDGLYNSYSSARYGNILVYSVFYFSFGPSPAIQTHSDLSQNDLFSDPLFFQSYSSS